MQVWGRRVHGVPLPLLVRQGLALRPHLLLRLLRPLQRLVVLPLVLLVLHLRLPPLQVLRPLLAAVQGLRAPRSTSLRSSCPSQPRWQLGGLSGACLGVLGHPLWVPGPPLPRPCHPPMGTPGLAGLAGLGATLGLVATLVCQGWVGAGPLACTTHPPGAWASMGEALGPLAPCSTTAHRRPTVLTTACHPVATSHPCLAGAMSSRCPCRPRVRLHPGSGWT